MTYEFLVLGLTVHSETYFLFITNTWVLHAIHGSLSKITHLGYIDQSILCVGCMFQNSFAQFLHFHYDLFNLYLKAHYLVVPLVQGFPTFLYHIPL